MQEAVLLPAAAERNLIETLRTCRHRKSLEHARRLHGYMCQHGLSAHRVLGNHLVPTLVECGLLQDALQVFDNLSYRSEHAWTSLVSGYIKCSEPQLAFQLYQRMQHDGSVQPSRFTYLALLNACACSLDLDRGREIHGDIVRRGLDRDLLNGSPLVGNSLVDMYSKCSSLPEARGVLDGLQGRDVVSWAALTAGYAEKGVTELVGNSLQQMESEGILPDSVMFLCSLKACGMSGDLPTGQEIHSRVVSRGLEAQLHIGNSLVDMYTKSGSLVEAREVFERLPGRDVVSWATLLVGYAERGLDEELHQCLQQMHHEGISPDPVIFVCNLKTCSTAGSLKTGQEIHSQIIETGHEKEPFIGTALVDMYSRSGALIEAHKVFDELPLRNTVIWNALIAGYAECGLSEEVGGCLEAMQLEEVCPDSVTFVLILKACCTGRSVALGQRLHAEIMTRGLDRESHIGSILVDLYAKCSLLAESQQVFDRLLIRSVVSWGALIAGYSDQGRGSEVLKCFHEMQLGGVPADAGIFVCGLKACGNAWNLEAAEDIHSRIVSVGLDSDPYVGSTLVDAYRKCGALAEAHHAFVRLPVRGTVSWNVLVAGYLEHEFTKEAVDCLCQMQLEGVPTDAVTYVFSLKACDALSASETGRDIHAEIVKKGLESDVYVSSTLVDMYTNYSLFAEACHILDKLPAQNAVPWCALIAGYVEHGLGDEAINCFGEMLSKDINPDPISYICCLRACGMIGFLETGQELHTEVVKRGWEQEQHVGNAIVHAYAKCGLLSEACVVFTGLLFRDSVSWNALLAGYGDYGLDEEVLKCFQQMQLEKVPANDSMFVCSLKACGNLKVPEMGQEIHAETIKQGLERELSVGSTLVDMYTKCGLLIEAHQVFHGLPVQDATLHNVSLTGASVHGLVEQTEHCPQQVQVEGMFHDAFTSVGSLKGHGTTGARKASHELHAEIVKKGLEREVSIGSKLMDMYFGCGLHAEACEVFNWFPVRNVALWVGLIAGYNELGLSREAVNCLQLMQLEGISPDLATFVYCLKACGSIGALERSQDIHAEIIKRGWERDLYVGSAVVDTYCKCLSLAEACQVFDGLRVRDTVVWNMLLAGFVNVELDDKVLAYFKQMLEGAVSPDDNTFVLCLKACGIVGALETGRKIHSEVLKSGLERNIAVSNTLIDMYGKFGLVEEAQELFDKMSIKDILTWTIMMEAYAENHAAEMAVGCFEHMLEHGVKPDSIAFTCVLAACSQASLVVKGQECFELMRDVYRIEPTLDHYVCMVYLYAKSGYIYEAEKFIAGMQCPYHEILISLLSACKFYGEVELGLKCFQWLLGINGGRASAQLLVEDLYANAGRWNDINRVKEMKDEGAEKKPSDTFVQINEQSHGTAVDLNLPDSISEVFSFMNDEGHLPHERSDLGHLRKGENFVDDVNHIKAKHNDNLLSGNLSKTRCHLKDCTLPFTLDIMKSECYDSRTVCA